MACAIDRHDTAQRHRLHTSELQSNFHNIIYRTADGIVVIDPDGMIRFANPAAETLFGRSASDLEAALFGFPVVAGETTEIEIVREDSRPVLAEMRVVDVEWEGEPASLAALRDITQRKEAEQALLASQKKYEALVNSIDGIVWEADAATFEFLFASQKAERLLGYPVERWLDEPTFWQDHLHPDDQGWAPGFCQTAVDRGVDHEFEYRMIAADGRIVWLRDIVTVVFEDNVPVRLRGVMVDITQRKQAENALRQSEQQYRRIVETAYEGIWVLDTDGYVRFVNRRMADMLEYTVDELSKRSLLDFIDEKWHPEAQAHLANPQQEAPAHLDLKFRRKDGSGLWAMVSTNMIPDHGENFAGSLWMVIDITDRKQTEEALRQSEKIYCTMTRKLPNTAVILFDHNLRYRIAEGQALSAQGYTKENIEGKTAEEVLTPAAREQLLPHYRAVLDGKEHTFEIESDQRSYHVHAIPIRDEQGEVLSGLLVLQDITEYKRQAKAEAEAQAAAARAAQRKRELTSMEHFAQPAGPHLPASRDTSELFSAATLQDLMEAYGNVLDLALEQRTYKVEHDVSEDIRSLAEQLSAVLAGPRDVIELHLRTLRQKSSTSNPVKAQAYAEEGRLTVLELMGYLAWFYRNRLFSRGEPPDATT